MQHSKIQLISLLAGSVLLLTHCTKTSKQEVVQVEDSLATKNPQPISQPLITTIYTADPSAHVFNDRIYIYPSHDVEAGIPENDLGDHFDMRDYHVLSMDSVGGMVNDHGVSLDIKNVPWAGRQMWAPDAAFANGTYYLYFPAKDKNPNRLRIVTALTLVYFRMMMDLSTCTLEEFGEVSYSDGIIINTMQMVSFVNQEKMQCCHALLNFQAT
jgi:hypothetical protein